MKLRLITIRFSHYCEKARWALERAELRFGEEPHLPLFSWGAALAARARRTVPALVTPHGVLADSADIVRFADRARKAAGLLPHGDPDVERLMADFDRRLGPATRRLAYFHGLADEAFVSGIFREENGPAWERTVGRAISPALTALMRRRMRIDAEGARLSAETVDAVFGEVASRIEGGRPFLCGEAFTAADLTFASLAAPVLLPEPYAKYIGDWSDLPRAFVERVEHYRATPAGAFAMKLYATER